MSEEIILQVPLHGEGKYTTLEMVCSELNERQSGRKADRLGMYFQPEAITFVLVNDD